jgi:hypothetical protein
MARRVRESCCECCEALIKDEVALSQKMVGREIEDFYCIHCLADYLECTIDDLKVKIMEFKEQGCGLFL